MSAIKDALLWGGYSHGNVGDELTLAVAIRDMRLRYGASIAILSPNPGYTRALFPDVEVIRYEPFLLYAPPPKHSILRRVWQRLQRQIGFISAPAPLVPLPEKIDESVHLNWVSAVRDAKLLYFVGGGYLTDLFRIDFFLAPAQVAKHFNIPIETAPLGVGPFRDKSAQMRCADAFSDIKIRVRDDYSDTLCRQHGLMVEKCLDDGFRVMEEIQFPAERGEERILGVNFFEQNGGVHTKAEYQWWRDLIAALVREGVELRGFCFHNFLRIDFSDTVELLTDVGLSPTLACPPDLDFRDACRRIANYRAILTCRFHSAVVANQLGIPTLAVANGAYYKAKMAAAVEGAKAAQVIDPSTSPVDGVVNTIVRWMDVSNQVPENCRK